MNNKYTIRVLLLLTIFLSLQGWMYGQTKAAKLSAVADAFIRQSFDPMLQHSRRAGTIQALLHQGDTLAWLVPLYPKGFIILTNSPWLYPVPAYTTETHQTVIDSTSLFFKILTKDLRQRTRRLKHPVSHADSLAATSNREAWTKLENNTLAKSYDVQYGPWLSSVWGGVNCYDFYSDPIYVGNYYTPHHYSPGCVATASAIVMHYYKWPPVGLGSHTDYDNKGNSQGAYYANFGGTRYSWGRMLDKYMYEYSWDKQRAAMGLLSWHAAIAVDMDFEYSGSTSNLNRTPAALDNYFRYAAHYEDGSWYSFWPRLRENLRDEKPVILAISSSTGAGHVAVCDGYGYNSGQPTFYHLQFGWWGSYNGWYNLQGSWNASGYTIVDGGTFDIIPDVMAGTPAYDQHQAYTFQLPIMHSARLQWDDFEIWEGHNGSALTKIEDHYPHDTLQRTVNKPGNYRYKIRARVKGKYYANNYSTIGEVLVPREDSALVSLDFDGDDSFFVNDNAFSDLDVDSNYTLELWIKVNKFNPGGMYDVVLDRKWVFSLYLIQDYDADYALRFVRRSTSNSILASLRSDSSAVNLSFGQWVHVAVTRDSSGARLFINGREVDSSASPQFILPRSAKALNIGARYWGGSYSRYFNGEMDEIRLSEVARYHSGQQYDHYRIFPFEPDSATRLLLHLDEGSGTAPGDASRHFQGINLRLSPHQASYIVKPQESPIVYSKELTATLAGTRVELSWITSKEIDNLGFDIQKSGDAKDWGTIGFMPGNGTINGSSSYHFTDPKPIAGMNYYRLKQHEKNGRINYSRVDSLRYVLEEVFYVSPNPASAYVVIHGIDIDTINTIQLTDIGGHRLPCRFIGSNKLDISMLADGVYLLYIEQNQQVLREKIVVKQR